MEYQLFVLTATIFLESEVLKQFVVQIKASFYLYGE